jgi:hypothetical protein
MLEKPTEVGEVTPLQTARSEKGLEQAAGKRLALLMHQSDGFADLFQHIAGVTPVESPVSSARVAAGRERRVTGG